MGIPLLFLPSAQPHSPNSFKPVSNFDHEISDPREVDFFGGRNPPCNTVHPVPPQSPPDLGSESLESLGKTVLGLPVGPHAALGRGRGCESFLRALLGTLGCSGWWGLWLPLSHTYFHRKHGCGCICVNHKTWEEKKLNLKSVWQNN